jgi:hypothetical protein
VAVAVEVSGTLSVPTVWTASGSPYEVTGSVTVAEGATLTLEAGTVVRFRQHTGLFVLGHLEAAGTAEAGITLQGTTAQAGWWRGVQVSGNGSARLVGCDLAHGGYWDSVGLRAAGTGSVVLEASTLRDTAGNALLVVGGYSRLHSLNNRFLNNTRGVHVGTGATWPDRTSTFSGNTSDVVVEGGTVSGEVIWGLQPEYSLVLSGSVTVPVGSRLTLLPGTVVKVAQHAGIWVQGHLDARGTAELPLHLTSLRDDSMGGDANRDGAETMAEPGWWRGLFITEQGTAELAHGHLRYAGYWDALGMFKGGAGSLSLSNWTLSHMAGLGMKVSGNTGDCVLDQVIFRDNTGSGLQLQAGAVMATACRFERNGAYGMIQEPNDGLDHAVQTFADNAWGSVGVNGGTLTVPRTWALGQGADFTVVVRASLTVASEATLTVAPGVRVQFAQHTGCFVPGRLVAVGTAELPVILQGVEATAGWWRGVQVTGQGTAQLEHVRLQHGGYWDSVGLWVNTTQPVSLRHSVIEQQSGDGLRLAGGYSKLDSQHNQFRQSTRGVRVGVGATWKDATSDFSSNSVDVSVEGGTFNSEVTWALKPDYALRVEGSVTVAAGGRLTVDPGTMVKVAQHAGIWVQGHLQANGTSAQPVVFTDWRDDTAGGDTNRDGTETTPGPGWWRGLHVLQEGSVVLTHGRLSYAGYWDSVGLLLKSQGPVVLRNWAFQDHGGDGLRLDGQTGAVTADDCRWTGNAQGILVRNQATPLVLGRAWITGNTVWGIHNDGPAEVDARQAWWGEVSGPQHATLNPQGTGNPVTDQVLFEPWSTSTGPAEATLQVILAPSEVLTLGVAWTVDGVSWQHGGQTLTLAAGTYQIQASDAIGWQTPAATSVELAEGQAQVVTLTYVRSEDPGGGDTEFEAGPTMSTARMGHHAARLPDGRILLMGGHGTGFRALASAELWDPESGSMTTLTMRHTHDMPALAQWEDGRILLAGGSADLGIPQYAASEIFDPATGTFTSVGNLVRFRSGAGAAVLTGGQVLVAGAWWTHNDAHTYGERFDPTTGGFTATGPLGTRRAYPWVLPTADGGAVVFGGVGVNGGSLVESVERFDSTTGTFTTLREGLFPGEPGWGLTQDMRSVGTQRLPDGRYLLLARRSDAEATRYRLFTYDPVSLEIAVWPVTPELPDSREVALWSPVVDGVRGRAHLLAQVTGASSPQVRLHSVDLATGRHWLTPTTHTLTPTYHLSGAAVIGLVDGRILVSGGSQDGTNFQPVNRSFLITPGKSATPLTMRCVRQPDGSLKLSWPAGLEGQVETSTDLRDWTELSGSPAVEATESTVTVPVPGEAGVRFYRVRRTNPNP